MKPSAQDLLDYLIEICDCEIDEMYATFSMNYSNLPSEEDLELISNILG